MAIEKQKRGRPCELSGGWSQVTIQLEPEDFADIEQQRGREPRSAYLRHLIHAALAAARKPK